MIYFGYGSNLLAARIERRLGPCERLGRHLSPATSSGFTSAAATAPARVTRFAPGTRAIVCGERCSAWRRGSSRSSTASKGPATSGGRSRSSSASGGLEADLYAARPEARAPGLPPFDWYKELVLSGARENRLPRDYLDAIEAVPSVADPDPERAERNRALTPRSATPGR